MIKKCLAITMGLMLATTAYANEIEHFVGFGTSDGMSHNADFQFEPNFRAGAVLNDNHRVTGTYAYATDSRVTNFFVSYDYMVNLSDTSNWQWLIGASGGHEFISHGDNDWTLGVQTGMRYGFNERFTGEVGYRVIDTWDNWQERNMSQLDSFYIVLDYKL
ncbi:hypothetical protein [Photobacterium minamisatsumaniensis]|uniref:hypothetical protein n=1 Tax=Photobacterium minamisatsumaniensis TaxID=2910233 RepID=UPI003D13AE81